MVDFERLRRPKPSFNLEGDAPSQAHQDRNDGPAASRIQLKADLGWHNFPALYAHTGDGHDQFETNNLTD